MSSFRSTINLKFCRLILPLSTPDATFHFWSRDHTEGTHFVFTSGREIRRKSWNLCHLDLWILAFEMMLITACRWHKFSVVRYVDCKHEKEIYMPNRNVHGRLRGWLCRLKCCRHYGFCGMSWLEKKPNILLIWEIIYTCMVDFIVEITQSYNLNSLVRKMAVLLKWYGLVFFALTCLAITITEAKCRGRTELTDLQGTISDGPDNYPENTLCEWLIKGE